MKILCLGDSLTEGDYGVFGKSGIANVHERSYPFFLRKLTGCEVENHGKCGYRASNYLSFIKSTQLAVKGADIVVIMLGTNGGMDCDDGIADYVGIINYCREHEPKAQIVLCTPPHSTENPEYSNCGYMNNIRIAAEAVRSIAFDEGLPLIDVFDFNEICEDNIPIYQPNDGLHFTEEGYLLLAGFICHRLTAMFPALFSGK